MQFKPVAAAAQDTPQNPPLSRSPRDLKERSRDRSAREFPARKVSRTMAGRGEATAWYPRALTPQRESDGTVIYFPIPLLLLFYRSITNVLTQSTVCYAQPTAIDPSEDSTAQAPSSAQTAHSRTTRTAAQYRSRANSRALHHTAELSPAQVRRNLSDRGRLQSDSD